MKEEEAKGKVCPFVAMAIKDSESLTEIDVMCFGSKCMMWRWDKVGFKYEASSGNRIPADSNSSGYCGLAGKE